MKPTISKEEDQFLSELIEKCCEFEPNKRIEFKSICNLIEKHFSRYSTHHLQQIQIESNNNKEEYKTTPTQHEYNQMKIQNETTQDH